MPAHVKFASQFDPAAYTKWVWVRARRNDTIRNIASRRGYPQMAGQIADQNRVRSTTVKLKQGRLLKAPGSLGQAVASTALFQDGKRPVIKDGYAVYTALARQGRVSVRQFTGYNPAAMDIAVTFDNFTAGDGLPVERQIVALERLAGRGSFQGAGFGPPQVIRIFCTDSRGSPIWLIPETWQGNPRSKTGPLWTIDAIAWDDGALSDGSGRRIRADAVVSVGEYTPLGSQLHAAARSTVSKTPYARPKPTGWV